MREIAKDLADAPHHDRRLEISRHGQNCVRGNVVLAVVTVEIFPLYGLQIR
jgi:hypothetical protein